MALPLLDILDPIRGVFPDREKQARTLQRDQHHRLMNPTIAERLQRNAAGLAALADLDVDRFFPKPVSSRGSIWVSWVAVMAGSRVSSLGQDA
jgi:hypothetical protein